jgi:hypothetical protein
MSAVLFLLILLVWLWMTLILLVWMAIGRLLILSPSCWKLCLFPVVPSLCLCTFTTVRLWMCALHVESCAYSKSCWVCACVSSLLWVCTICWVSSFRNVVVYFILLCVVFFFCLGFEILVWRRSIPSISFSYWKWQLAAHLQFYPFHWQHLVAGGEGRKLRYDMMNFVWNRPFWCSVFITLRCPFFEKKNWSE